MTLNKGQILFNRYEIINWPDGEIVKAGGLGEVYLARNLNFPFTRCVVKRIRRIVLLDEENRQNAINLFNREAQILSQHLKHDSIANFVDFYPQSEGESYLVSEFIDGQTLEDEHVTWQEDDLINFLDDMLNTLKYVHDKGIIHKDIKPSNLIRRKGENKFKFVLIDFGVAKFLTNEIIEEENRCQTTRFGTPDYYRESEIKRPKFCSDIYALGITALELLTGEKEKNFQNLPVSSELINILKKMTESDQEKRYQQAEDVLKDLRKIEYFKTDEPPNSWWQMFLDILSHFALVKIKRELLIAIISAIVSCLITIWIHTPETVECKNNQRISRGECTFFYQKTEYSKNEGVKAIANKDYKKAIDKLTKSLRYNPNDPESLIYLNNAQIGKAEETYTIAVSVPIGTDPNASKEVLRGVALAQDEINESGGINEVKLKIAIANDDEKKGVGKKVASALGTENEVLGVIGHSSSDVTLEVVSVYENNKLMLISPLSTSNELIGKSEYFCRTVPSNYIIAEKLVGYMMNRINPNEVAIFYNENNKYSRSLKDSFKKYLTNVNMLGEFNLFRLNNRDIKKQVDSLIRNSVDVLLLPLDYSMFNNEKLQTVIKSNQRKSHILGGDDLYTGETLKIGDMAIGIVVPTFWDFNRHIESPFVMESKKLWGDVQVNWRTKTSYDAARVFIEALQRSTANGLFASRAKVQTKIRSNNFSAEGGFGTIQFDQNCELKQPTIELVKVKDGEFVSVDSDTSPEVSSKTEKI